MRGRVYRQRGRKNWRVVFPCNKVKGGKIYVNLYAGKFPLVSKEMGEHVLAEINAQFNRDPEGFDPTPWVHEREMIFQKAWMIYQQQAPCKDARHDQRQTDYENWMFPYFKGKSLNQIDEYQIREWWETIPKTYKPSTLKRIRATLRAFLNFHKVTRVKMLEFPKVTVPKKTPEWLTRPEQEARLKFVPEQHQRVFRFLIDYGPRSSEVANLERVHLDWEKGIITFTERKNDKDNTLPILEESKSYLKPGKLSHWKYVFATEQGQKYSRQVLYRILADALKAGGFKPIPLKNATRHSKANQLLAEGRSIAYVARWLGNSPSVIERNYGDISVETLRRAERAPSVPQENEAKS